MQSEATLFIKGMVCHRCVMVVRDELTLSGHQPLQVELGKATLPTQEKEVDTEAIRQRLEPLGFSLLENRQRKIIKEVKALADEVYSGDYDFPQTFRFSLLLAEKLQQRYESISDVFVAAEGRTIEQYILTHRIEKVKEYLVYSALTLADIAFQLNFSSVAHLSAQFKQHTGLTPSFFRKIKQQKKEVSLSSKPEA